jgi:hypothetical protein
MFAPLLPVALMLFAIAISRVQGRAGEPQRVLAGTLVILSCAYVAANARSIIYQPRLAAQHVRVQAALAEEISPGLTLDSWIAAHVPAGQVVVATHGQATGYVLHRPTLSLAPQAYTTQQWDEPEIRALMLAYRAQFLIVYPGDEPGLYQSRFLSGLLTGAVPSWLSSAARSRDAAVFRSELN